MYIRQNYIKLDDKKVLIRKLYEGYVLSFHILFDVSIVTICC